MVFGTLSAMIGQVARSHAPVRFRRASHSQSTIRLIGRGCAAGCRSSQ
jgi:hypothetical protein